MSEFDMLRSSAAGMEAERAALDVAARNVAAAQATPDGRFARLVPQYAVAPVADAPLDPGVPADPAAPPDLGGPPDPDARGGPGSADAAPDDGDPSDPLPIRYLGTRTQRGGEVDAVTEMVAVLDAQRAYEANASVFDVGKRLAERTIDLGRLS